jgi:photosystem II stability/assembly factor-like uncharacterized protein
MKPLLFLFIEFLLFPLTLSAQDGWFWQNPLPQGNHLNDIDIVNDHLAYAIGNRGTLLKTTNGGVSWEIKQSNTLSDLRALVFINENVGWICSDTAISKTTDGGNNWVNQFTGIWLNDIVFTNSNSGLAVGNFGIILKTTNAGETWQRITISWDYDFNSISFVNDSIGWVVGDLGKIIKTTDGGNTWNEQYLSPTRTFTLVDFIDEENGWAIDPYYTGGRLFKTTDGGNNWENKLFNTSPYFIKDFILIDENNALFFCSKSLREGGILKTTDGGDSWSSVFDSNDNLFSADKFENSILSVGTRGIIVKSTNLGIDWLYNSSKLDLLYIWDASFINEDYAWLLIDFQKIYKSTDGGNNWSLVSYFQNQILRKIHFIDNLTGWAVGDTGIILKTIDGGQNWVDQSIASISIDYKEIYFINAEVGWIFGINNLLQTTNGGDSWDLKHSWNLGTDISCLYFLNENDGWITWYDRLLSTSDGGTTWDSINYPSQSGLGAVKFINENIGWAVGKEIYKTTDGGLFWIEQRGYRPERLNHIEILDSNNVWAAGNYGALYYTSDGGTNWQQQNCNISGIIMNLSFINKTMGWVVGWHGEILKTTNNGATFIKGNEVEEIISNYSLSHNFPNPFNPSTTISYSLPTTSMVQLKILDILGQEIATLVNEEKTPGNYSVEWNATQLASGVYFYRIQAGNFVQTKKMILMK